MTRVGQAVVINATCMGPDPIRRYRRLVILKGLELRLKGLKHSRDADLIGARQELEAAGVRPARTHKKLYEQFKQLVENS